MELNKKTRKQIMELIIFAGIVLWTVFNYEIFIGFISFIIKLIMPVIVGIAIAFIINVPMKYIENKIFKINKRKNKKLVRIISLCLSIILMFGIVGLIMFLIIPEFIEAINAITKTLPVSFDWVNDVVDKITNLYPDLKGYVKDIDVKSIVDGAFGTTGNIVSVIVAFFSNIVSKIVIFCIGFIIAIYLLLDKENLSRQARKILIAFLPDKLANKIVKIVKLSNVTFTNFVTGQCLDAIIFGLIFFITMSILKMPYALVISVLLVVTALIPYIGAFITLVVGTVLIAVTSPIKALWFIVLFLVLQQVDGNILVPKIVGKSVGLPALWAFVAVLVGGSIFGFIGVIISIPLSSIIYTLLREWVNERISDKNQK